MTDSTTELTALTAAIVEAYASRGELPAAELPDLIRNVHATLEGLASGNDGATSTAPVPSVPAKESVFPDRVICLGCGYSGTLLRRHLSTAHGLTPEQYRMKWGLPRDYPIVAPNYTKLRSSVATKSGLGLGVGAGRKRRTR